MNGNDDAPSPLNVTPIAAQPVVEPLQEFLYNTPRSTVRGLKDCTKVTPVLPAYVFSL